MVAGRSVPGVRLLASVFLCLTCLSPALRAVVVGLSVPLLEVVWEAVLVINTVHHA